MIANRCRFAVMIALAAVGPAWAQTLSEEELASLALRAIGPAVMGGRIDDVAVDERDPAVIYVGSASGGIWKSQNAGVTWTSIFDREKVSSIGDIAIAPSDSNVIWVGTGEPNNRQSSTFGAGVFRSVDGGRSWKATGLEDTQHIGRIVVDPTDADTAYVAALGHLWGPNRERGVFKTVDGGATWQHVLVFNEDTGAVDLVMNPRNRRVVYAAAYQRRRAPWGFNGGGPHGGIYKTVDGGRSWTKVTNGLPAGTVGRIGLDIYRANPDVLYATVEHKEGGIFRSDDGGDSWRKINGFNPRPMYYSKIRIDPTNDRRIYVLGSSFFVSNDGGRTFEDPATGRPGPNASMSPTYDVGVHGDHHALWINPANPRHLYLGNDGGLYVTYDGTRSWDKINNMPLGQIYGLGIDDKRPYNIYAGLQDTHSWGGPSATRFQIGITNADWVQINFGDGMYAQVDPTDADTIYTESQDGNLTRFHRPTGDRRSIKPVAPQGEPAYRFNWTSPMQVSRHDGRVLYFGGNRLFISKDRGENWSATQDLTRGEDRGELPIMGGLSGPDMLSRYDGVSFWGTITTLAESPIKAGLLWVGTDDGNVQVSSDGGASWTNVATTLPGLPKAVGRISRVEPSFHEASTAYVSIDRHELDDFAPYLFKTTDLGKTWRPVSRGLPAVGWINVVREHPRNPNLLFVGTETGLFASLDGGGHWTRLAGNFPTVPVDDLVIHPRDNDLVVGTHGRSIYVLDDLAPLEHFAEADRRKPVAVYAPRPALIVQRWKQESYSAQRVFAGQNPPVGAWVSYYVPRPLEQAPTLRVLDAAGTLVRSLEGSNHPGFNRVLWDLRAAAPSTLPAARGPFVVPGTYTLELAAGTARDRVTLAVEPDPAFPLSDDERRARFAFLTSANDLLARTADYTDRLRTVVDQLDNLVPRLKGTGAPSSLIEQSEQLLKGARDLQTRLAGTRGDGEEGEGFGASGLRGRAQALFGEIDGSGAQQGTLSGPTATQRRRLDTLTADVSAAATSADRLLGGDLARLNDALKVASIPHLHVPAPRPR